MSASLARRADVHPMKQNLRTTMRQQRDRIPLAERKRAANAAASHACAYLDPHRPATVALYAAVQSELDTTALAAALAARHIRLVYPRIVTGSLVLEFRAADPGELLAGTFSIPEPGPTHAPVAIADIDAFVVPGLAFDGRGNRLGWGRGYYDHTLIHHRDAPRLGLGFAAQVVPSLPRGGDDVPMTAVATEVGVTTCSLT